MRCEANTHGDGESRPTAVLGSRNRYPALDRADIHNCRAAVRHYLATVPACPPSMAETMRRLSGALTASQVGRENTSAASLLAMRGLLSTRQAADALGVTPRAVRYRAEELGAVRVGQHLAYPAETVHRLAQQKREGAAHE